MPALVSKGPGRAQNNVLVDGCSPNSSFKTVNVSRHVEVFRRRTKNWRGQTPPPVPASGCDLQLEMNKGLVDFVNRNMENCIGQAWDAHVASRPELANIPKGSIRIYHEGCMGDHNHQGTPSWHNQGLAWDVAGIEVGGQAIWYTDGENRAFFDAFRTCWGENVKAFSPTCSGDLGGRRGPKKPAGTIGKEDKKHQNHLHLSLPCKNLLRKNQRMYVAGGAK